MERTQVAAAAAAEDRRQLERKIQELGDWFHNIDLKGVKTAPGHFLGDYPNVKWRHFRHVFPEDMRGLSVLDIGCNGGFYSIEMKRRGADRVVGVDVDDRYLDQARFAARTLGFEVEFLKRSVYEVDSIPGQFDYVLYMGVFYHLRYPLYALDTVVKKVKERLVFQTMLRGSDQARAWETDYDFWRKDVFDEPDWPKMHFVEHRYAGDQTNWWIPNRAAAEAMLRSSGLEILEHPEGEIWVCAPTRVRRDGRWLRDLELEGTL